MATGTVVGLKGGNDPSIVPLGGGAGRSSPHTTAHMKSLPSQSVEEYITFDFMVNLKLEILEETHRNNESHDNDADDEEKEKESVDGDEHGDEHEDENGDGDGERHENVKVAIKECVDCEIEQIRELVLKKITDDRSRVKGKISTDDWELPMLQKRFKSIIPDHLLSTNIQRICNLEDRPQISRFSYKTSVELKEKRKTTDDLRSEKKPTATKIVVTKPMMTTENGHEEPPAPSNWERQKTPMKKRAGREPGSMDSEKEPLGSDSDDDQSQDIQISIKKLDGDTFFVSISISALVQGLKTIIHDQQNVEVDRQRLIYRAQELRNEVPLAQYGIQSGSTLHLVVRRNLPQQNQGPADDGPIRSIQCHGRGGYDRRDERGAIMPLRANLCFDRRGVPAHLRTAGILLYHFGHFGCGRILGLKELGAEIPHHVLPVLGARDRCAMLYDLSGRSQRDQCGVVGADDTH